MILYPASESSFFSNGLGKLKAITGRPAVTQFLNGAYELDFTLSELDELFNTVDNEMIVKAMTPTGYQPFRIYNIKPAMKTKRIQARHILLRRLERDLVEDTNIVGLNGPNAIRHLLDRSQNDNTDILVTGTNGVISSSRLVRKNVLTAIFSDEANSILSRWGGEIGIDTNTIRFNSTIGEDRGVKIKHRRNLLGYNGNIDYEGVITRILPQGFDALFLPEKYVISDKEAELGFTSYLKVDFPEVISDQSPHAGEGALPHADAINLLRQRAQETLSQLEKPKVNIDINFIDLSTTEQYKDFKQLEKINLGDIVHFEHKELKATLKVTGYVYNPLLERMLEIHLGTQESALFSSIRAISVIKDTLANLEQAQDNTNVTAIAQQAATDLINAGFGGHVKVYPNRILFMDTDDEQTATQVWQWNINGLGFSATGVAGPYTTAITRDGAIVADFITTGQLDGNLIRAGSIQSGALSVEAVSELLGDTVTTTQFEIVAGQVTSVINKTDELENQFKTELSQTHNSFEMVFSNLSKLVDDIGGDLEKEFNELKRYIRFIDGHIHLGDVASDITLVLENDILYFNQGGKQVAYLSNNKLYVVDGEFLNSLRLGNFAFLPRNNGSLDFNKV